MKTLKEKKMLVRLAKMLGEEVDPVLLASIEKEERLSKAMFKEEVLPEPVIETPPTEPVVSQEIQVLEKPEPIVEAAPPEVAPSTAEFNVVSKDLIKQTVDALSQSKPIASSKKSVPEMVRDKDIDAMKRTIADLVRKVGTLSWGGGGSGSVMIREMEDFNKRTNGENRFLRWASNTFFLDDTRVYANSGSLTISTNGVNFINTNSFIVDVSPGISSNANVGFHLRDSDQGPIRSLLFDTAGPIVNPPPQGTISWNNTDLCLEVRQNQTTLQIGQENYIRVINNLGYTANQGMVVAFSGVATYVDTNYPTITPALANSTFNPIYTIGVLTENIANGQTGFATTLGKVHGLNTTAWNIGDILYISNSTPGALTTDQPTAPNVAVSVAAVVKKDAIDGELLVRPTIVPRLYYGSFSDTASQNCATSNTATAMVFNTTDFSGGHVVVNYNAGTNNAIQALNHGLYNYQFSSQFTSSSGSRSRIWIWIRKNGQDIPNTATVVAIESNGGVTAPAWNFLLSMQPNDKFQLMWATDAADKVSMIYQANTAFCPAIPSVILTVSQVNQ